ncbi:hypothetical protein ISF_09190 [Cordyceps fumosorosea ARSEF 2679]|uniref:Uncharacterized protein n=1 Tax=Cordyceps fumosorosea (strain ARSEF 2679) TaxID=1081104 RepID=A0A167LC85_CORFA|nr:hypothetical protein ISF_09190 [Cordyceps fumosorosea ARSEF 2679]OAA52912.1 hypothetical protein ISF_09190 [Cordyceps fumosorosea ARSEF 2679]
MFTAEIVWKGLVYTLFMMLGKLLCGIWLLRLPDKLKWVVPKALHKHEQKKAMGNATLEAETPVTANSSAATEDTSGDTSEDAPGAGLGDISAEVARGANGEASEEAASRAGSHDVSKSVPGTISTDTPARTVQNTMPAGVKPRSIYPASILGCAMMARGEIGFLISSIAESRGIFASGTETTADSKIFLCVTWAILLCTVIGPLAVGLLVRRVKKLQRRVEASGGQVKGDVLGVWGVE